MQMCYDGENRGDNMEYRIEKANWDDLPRITEIYAFARKFMAENGNPSQWGTTHPPVAQLEKDIENERLYLVKNEDTVRGVFYFCVEEDPTYAVIFDGAWHSDRPYGVIHRIASDGSGGVLRAAVEFGKKKADYLRIDTHGDNQVMQRAVQKQGFRYCGIIYIGDGTPRLAYDLLA